MSPAISRRSLLIGLGGGLAATSIVWSLGRFDFWRPGPGANIPAATQKYVDHEGWFLSVEDKQKLLATATFKQLDNTNLAGGGDIGNHPVRDVSECASWCLMEPRCQSFAFLKPERPDASRLSMCWIKSSVPDAVPSELFTSGIVER